MHHEKPPFSYSKKAKIELRHCTDTRLHLRSLYQFIFSGKDP
jgi:hypothetical protein